MLDNKIATIEDFHFSNGVDYMEMVDYVVKNKDFTIELKDFFIIAEGFRLKWNESTGKIVGDGDFKNAVYNYIESAMDDKVIKKYIPQKKVDDCIDLILNYLVSIGQWYKDFSKS